MSAPTARGVARMARLLKEHISTDWGMTNKLVHSIASTLCTRRYKGLFTPDQTAGSARVVFATAERPFTTIWNVGNHFVCVYCTDDFTLYLDPFGQPCHIRAVERLLRQANGDGGGGNRLFYNTTPIQSQTSKHCGLYAVLFCLYYDEPARKVRLNFTKSGDKNDQLCTVYLQALLNKQ